MPSEIARLGRPGARRASWHQTGDRTEEENRGSAGPHVGASTALLRAGSRCSKEPVAVADGGSDRVSRYDVGAGDTLNPKSPATVAAGLSTIGVAVSPDGRSVYVANQGSDDVTLRRRRGPGGLARGKTVRFRLG